MAATSVAGEHPNGGDFVPGGAALRAGMAPLRGGITSGPPSTRVARSGQAGPRERPRLSSLERAPPTRERRLRSKLAERRDGVAEKCARSQPTCGWGWGSPTCLHSASLRRAHFSATRSQLAKQTPRARGAGERSGVTAATLSTDGRGIAAGRALLRSGVLRVDGRKYGIRMVCRRRPCICRRSSSAL
jgi:hypothetical protein